MRQWRSYHPRQAAAWRPEPGQIRIMVFPDGDCHPGTQDCFPVTLELHWARRAVRWLPAGDIRVIPTSVTKADGSDSMLWRGLWRRWCAPAGPLWTLNVATRRPRPPVPRWTAAALEERSLLSTITVTSLADN